jgi:hypothetical protein
VGTVRFPAWFTFGKFCLPSSTQSITCLDGTIMPHAQLTMISLLLLLLYLHTPQAPQSRPGRACSLVPPPLLLAFTAAVTRASLVSACLLLLLVAPSVPTHWCLCGTT